MEKTALLRAWGGILAGYPPNLSIEITRECPLRCPGCYAYGEAHLGGGVVLRELADFKGQALIDGVLRVVRERRPVHLSIVGGEPLVRFRELEILLPQLTGMGVHTQVVTSAVRPIPAPWATMPKLQVVVSIDGLQPEHDLRRAPATYDRILKHIAGQHVTVHCTLTRQQARPDMSRRSRSSGRRMPTSNGSGSVSTPPRRARTRRSVCGRPTASCSSRRLRPCTRENRSCTT